MSAPTANQIARALAECAPNLPEKKAPQGVRPCGALLSKAGLWRQPRPTQATIFLHYSKYQHNAFDVPPTVCSFPEPKSELSPRVLCPKGISKRPTASRRAEGQRRHRTPEHDKAA